MLEMFVLQHTSICPNFIFIVLRIQLPLCSNAHDDVTDLEICGFHKNTNSRYLKKKTLFLLQIKKIIYHILRITLWQKIVLQ